MSARSTPRRLAGDALALGIPFAVGTAAGIITAQSIPTWYGTLQKPAWNPPEALFGPIWAALYLLMGVALVLVRHSPVDQRSRRRAEAIFGLQLALNFAWTMIFFGGRSISAGLVAVVLLWASVVATIREFGRVRRSAALVLLPYLAWATLAVVLNAEIWRLNAG